MLRRPDVFHAAVAGAPVTDWRLYDTHYTERYLGDPDDRADGVRRAARCFRWRRTLDRPLLLIHGLADDNVVAAHTLQLSAALLAAGRPHEVLPLSGVTHMTPQEVVAENLLLHQLEFLRRSLPPSVGRGSPTKRSDPGSAGACVDRRRSGPPRQGDAITSGEVASDLDVDEAVGRQERRRPPRPDRRRSPGSAIRRTAVDAAHRRR